MDLYRSFTTRRNKHDAPLSPESVGRAASQRGGRPVFRGQISSPLALLSTSNVMLNNAQRIAGTSQVDMPKTSSELSTSDEDSDISSVSIRTRDTLTDASSFEQPSSPEPEPNHLSCYFKPAVDTHAKVPSRSPSSSTMPTSDTPKLPQRVPSHSKRAHENLHRKRSIQRMMSPPVSGRDLARTSSDLSSAPSAFVEAPKEGPFGNELAQLDQIAEEFGHTMRDAAASDDAVAMHAFGLAQFGVSDYLNEIEGLIADTFGAETTVPTWI